MGKCKDCESWGKPLPDIKSAEESATNHPNHKIWRHHLKIIQKNNKVFRVCSCSSFHGELDYERCKTNGATYGEFCNPDSGYGKGEYFVTGKDFGCIHFKKRK